MTNNNMRFKQIKITSFNSAIMLWLCLVFSPIQNTVAETSSDYFFNNGKRYYINSDFESAIEAFGKAVASVPDSSEYHYWLGKSYGRLAENSEILTAYRLSNKTREEFELAVELDGTNRDALADLMEYYQQAPSFLGGGRDKAEKLRRHLDALDQGNNTVSYP